MSVRSMAIALAIGSLALPAVADSGTFQESKLDGRAIYNFRCYFCHGYSGDAKTVAASFLSPPPAAFTRATPAELPVPRIVATLRHGRPGTAMKSFASVLSEQEITSVAHFVHDEFVVKKAINTRYHTAENGWPDHERYRIAFPFAVGEIAMSQGWDTLTTEQASGKRLFLESCISCHDRGPDDKQDSPWEARPLSYPRNNFSFTAPPKMDATASASPYAMHDRRPKLRRLTRSERLGERLFQGNCAFCHGADGTGRNWIGSFLEPHPRDLRNPEFMSQMTRERFIQVVGDGLPNTSMPAWKNVLSEIEIVAITDYVSRAFHPLRNSAASLPRNTR